MTMWSWVKFSLSIAISLVVILAFNWLANFLYREDYPDELAIVIDGFEGPLVNRAVLQRSWPEGLEDLGSRAQLRAHMGNIEDSPWAMRVSSAASLSSASAAPQPEPDLATLLAAADIASGERRARLCTACHTFNEGGRDGVGPNLWGVLGRDIAARSTFDYSSAMAGEPGEWTYEKLDAYLLNPAKAIPGNRMAFAGLRRAGDRADIIAYLRMQGSAQLPLPALTATGSDDAQH